MNDATRFDEALRRHRLVAILRGVDPSTAAMRTDTLYDAGVRLIEVAQSEPSALAALEAVVQIAPDDLMVGAGTVTTKVIADDAHGAGARFLVTPHLAPAVIAHAQHHEMGLLVGAWTPTEISLAREAGATFIKLFPASTMGPGYVKALMGPYPDLDIVVVGGIGSGNLAPYLEAGALGAGVGGALSTGNAFDRYADAAAEARSLVDLLSVSHP